MDPIALGILAYIFVQLLVGLAVSRHIETEDDYLVAGRRLGYGLGIFTVFATWFGAETCIGAAGAAYADGLYGTTADPFGFAACLLLMGFVYAVPLWNRKLTTMADLFRRRHSPLVEKLAALALVPASLLWASAQVRAFGQVLSASSSLNVETAITIAAAVVILYTVTGGLMADAVTDVVQGVALIAGLVILLPLIMGQGGWEALRTMDPSRLRLFGGAEVPPARLLESWAVPICGSVLTQELVSRVIATRSPTVARRSALIGGTMYFCVGMVPVLIGLAGPSLMPGLADPEQILPAIAKANLSPLLYVVFAGALVSAILSTVDSCLLSASGLLSHNVIVPMIPRIGEKGKLLSSRICVVFFGLLAYGIALKAQGVYDLVQEASSFGSAGVFTIGTFALFTRFGGPAAAVSTLAAGMGAWIAGAYWIELSYPFLTSLAASVGTYVAVGLVERARARAREAAPAA